MAVKDLFFITCLFGAFLQIQCSPIDTDNVNSEYKPDVRYAQVKVDGKEFNLTLVQRIHQVFQEKTPVWTIHSAEGLEDEITEVPYKERQINGIFYGDDDHMATLLTSFDESEREVYYNGLISIGTKIYKVDSAAEEWWRDSSAENVQSSQEQVQEESKQRSADVSDSDDDTLLDNALTTLYPKILAVVDYDLYNELGQDVDKIIEYVATFWEAMNLKFSKFNSPDVKITVTGVLIVKDEHVSLTTGEPNTINAKFIEKTGFVNYDTAIILTKSSSKIRRGSIPLGSICDRQYSAAFIEDHASYEGLQLTTLALGHMLNLPHDGGKGAESCNTDSGDVTFMSGADSTTQLTWSQCSRDIILEFSRTKAAACLENYWRYE